MFSRLHPLAKNQRAVIGLGLSLILLLAINIVSNVVLRPFQLDLTENKLFTVSQGTKDILATIDEPITMRLYFTKAMGEGNPAHAQHFVRVKELLERYATLSDGRIRVELLDAAPFTPAEDEAVAYGLTGVPYNEAGDLGYFGLVGANSTDDIDLVRYFAIDRENFLEYDVSKLIHRLTTPTKKVIGLISSLPIGGAGTIPNQEAPRWPLIETVKEFFEIRPLPPYIERIPDEIDVLWIVHPRGFDDHALYAIDQFVLNGGRALVFVDPIFESARGTPNAATTAARSELDRLLNAWGLSLASGRVAGDLDAARRVRVRHEGRIAVADYVAWLTLGPENLDLNDTVTGDIKKLSLGTPGVLEPLDKPGITITPLLTTGIRSMAIDVRNFLTRTDVIGLFRNFQPSGSNLILAARSTGTAKSAFSGGLPRITKPPAAGNSSQASTDQPPAHIETASTPINVIVVADVDMLHDEFWADVEGQQGQQTLVPNANNVDFVINALDNLTGSNALVALRGRSNVSRPFHLIQRIRQDAEQKFRKKEEELQQRLAQARAQMEAIMERNTRDNRVTLAPEQRAQLDSFRREMLSVRRELRDVQHALRTDLDQLDDWLKFLNIAAIPLLLVAGCIVVAVFRRSRNRQASQAD